MSEQKNVNMGTGEIHKLTTKYLDGKILSRIRLDYGTLFLEFGKLNDEGRRGEVSFMIQPSWRFSTDYRIKETSDWDKKDLKTLEQYVGEKLNRCTIDNHLHEIRLDFDNFCFSTLSTLNEDHLGRTLFFKDHLEVDNDEAIRGAMIWNDNQGIYFSEDKKKPA